MNNLEVLKGKTVVILLESELEHIEEKAFFLFRKLKKCGLIVEFAKNYDEVVLIEQDYNELLYLFLYDNLPVPTKEQGESIYHLHDITNPHHYWLDVLDEEHYDKALSYFVEVEKELSV